MDEHTMRMLGAVVKRAGGEIRFQEEELKDLCGFTLDGFRDPITGEIVVKLSEKVRE